MQSLSYLALRKVLFSKEAKYVYVTFSEAWPSDSLTTKTGIPSR